MRSEPKTALRGKEVRVLVITFRRSLADKLEEDLKDAGHYINYLSLNDERRKTGGMYKKPKLVVQVSP